MSIFFSLPFSDFSGTIGQMTISTGPVIIHSDGSRILLHISSSTGKYQFIGGRMDDRLSFRENALMRAREVVGDNSIELSDDNPTILFDMIQRDGKEEQILLIHYRASIANEEKLGNAEWFTFEQIEELDRQGKVSSSNIRICSLYFLKP